MFSFVASALAAWAICATISTKLKVTSFPLPEHRGLQIDHAAAAVTAGYEEDVLDQGMKISRSATNV